MTARSRAVLRALCLVAGLGQAVALAQDGDTGFLAGDSDQGISLEQSPNPGADITSVMAPDVEAAGGAVLRALDKTLGRAADLALSNGQSAVYGRIAVRLLECRYPEGNPASDAFAHLEVSDLSGTLLFKGWMVASSPALVALEHPRYDVWVLRCSTS